MVVTASADIDGTGSDAAKTSPEAESKEQTVPVECLPSVETRGKDKDEVGKQNQASTKEICQKATFEYLQR